MRKILSLLSFAVAVLFMVAFTGPQAKATHCAGGELLYVHISDSTYQFFGKFYRDCTGAGEPTSFTLCAFNTCTNQTINVNMNKWQGTLPPDNRPNGSSVSAGCSQYSNKCDNSASNVPGFREWWYMAIITLPLKCNYWRFAIYLCCRNTSTNLQGQDNFYVETTFNPMVSWTNSSPYYSVKPLPYVCLNQPYSYNNGAIDSDGDSLFSQMVNPLNTATCSNTNSNVPVMNLTPAINFVTNPFQTNNSFVLTGTNGQMGFTATQQGAATVTMKTREFRNNQEIGSIMRDVQVQVLPCSAIQPTLDTVTIGIGQFTNGFVYGCVGEKLDFCFDVKSTDTEAILLAEDNLATAIPGATLTYTNMATDSFRGCFEWTPQLKDVGNKSFIVLIKDSTCKPPGILLQYAKIIDLRIWGPTVASPDTSICIGEPAFLGVSGGADYEWTVLSGTNPSVSNPFIANPVANPKVTTTYQVQSRINPYCTKLNKDTVTITVLKGPDILGQKNDTTCPNSKLNLNVGVIHEPGVAYYVKWKPATGLSSDTVENPTTILKSGGQYTIEVSSSSNRCKTLDTAYIDVLTGMNIENPDTMICMGQYVDVRGVGDSRYAFSWKSNDPAVTFAPSDAVVTRITPSQTGTFTYKITGNFQPKCPRDTVAEFDIDVQPVPVVGVDDDASMCYGDTMQMHGSVSPANYPKYTFSWTPGIALDFPDRINPIFSAIQEGTTTLTFKATTPAGCTDSKDVELNVFSAQFLDMPGDTAICPGDSLKVDMTLTKEGIKFFWLPDFNISSVSAAQPTVWPVTDQQYSVYGVDSFGCMDTGNIKITVRPRAMIDLPDSVIIYPGESYRMDPGGNCLYYTWFPPLGLSNSDVSNPAVSPKVNTRYVVTGRTEAGCIATDAIDVHVVNDSYLTLPNAFTPGKRDNGQLKINRRGIATLKVFAVYNRWGVKVFETQDINQGWDGTFNGENQPMGVYIYTIEAVTPAGQTINKQGNVTLVR